MPKKCTHCFSQLYQFLADKPIMESFQFSLSSELARMVQVFLQLPVEIVSQESSADLMVKGDQQGSLSMETTADAVSVDRDGHAFYKDLWDDKKLPALFVLDPRRVQYLFDMFREPQLYQEGQDFAALSVIAALLEAQSVYGPFPLVQAQPRVAPTEAPNVLDEIQKMCLQRGYQPREYKEWALSLRLFLAGKLGGLPTLFEASRITDWVISGAEWSMVCSLSLMGRLGRIPTAVEVKQYKDSLKSAVAGSGLELASYVSKNVNIQ